jgi:uncharacterized protein involved in type VI secretion and phage assembly
MPGNSTPTVAMTDDVKILLNGTAVSVSFMNNLQQVEIEQSPSVPGMCKVVFYDENAVIVDDTTVDIGKEIEIQFKSRTQTSFTSAFKGEVVAIQPEYTEGLHITVTVIAFDKLHRLNRGRKTRTFLKMTDSAIISRIAQEGGLTAEVTSTSFQHEHLTQDNVTDLAYIQMLARRNGHEVRFVNGKVAVKAPVAGSPVATVKVGVDLQYFRPHLSNANQVTELLVKGWDVQNKAAIVGRATAPDSHPSVGYGKTGVQSTQTAFSAAQWVETNSTAVNQSFADTVAKARLNEINAGFLQGEGRTFGNPAIVPGAIIKLEGLGTRFSGNYKVTVARHTYSSEGVYETEFTVEGLTPSMVSNLAAPQNDPPRLWHGVVPAIVTNVNDPNNLGRVKVKYPWLNDTEESNWARVISIGAGTDRGLMIMPEVNDEVIVAFENGQFDVPYIVGGVWNGQDAAPMAASVYHASGKIVVRKLKTRTGHELTFTEKTDSSMIEILESKGLKITLDGTNKKIELLDGGLKITLDDTGKKITIDGGSTADVEIKGNNITLQATTKLSMTGTSQAELKGGMVNIN